jgi:prepilin-type N-terminal cleavage/methylation domain-containing protein
MCRMTPACSHRRCGGFTLWELVLALAVLAMLIGMTWPAVTQFMGEQRLKEDVATVRTELGATRSRAIRNGVTFQFRFEPGGRQFIVLPSERPVSMTAAAASQETSATTSIDPEVQVRTFQLVEGNRFEVNDPQRGSLGLAVATEKLTQDWLELFGGGSTLAQVNWSPAILFNADGTSQDAVFFVLDEEGRYQQVSVRGLTAAVSIGPVLRKRRL